MSHKSSSSRLIELERAERTEGKTVEYWDETMSRWEPSVYQPTHSLHYRIVNRLTAEAAAQKHADSVISREYSPSALSHIKLKEAFLCGVTFNKHNPDHE